jgi:endonuclease YncB( thermonuclease family)
MLFLKGLYRISGHMDDAVAGKGNGVQSIQSGVNEVMIRRTIFFLMSLILVPSLVFSHPGGLDRYGGHYDRQTGGYHCHRAGCSEHLGKQRQTFSSLEARCIGVIDGDTLKIVYRGVVEKVRLLGVDTPERGQPLYGEATSFTASLVEGRVVRLEFDRRLRGRYGRLLAYVYPQGGEMLNLAIIRRGYSRAYTKYPFKYMRMFMRIARESR